MMHVVMFYTGDSWTLEDFFYKSKTNAKTIFTANLLCKRTKLEQIQMLVFKSLDPHMHLIAEVWY